MPDAPLKPCPFCGFSEHQTEIEINELGKIGVIACDICGARAFGEGVMVGDDSDDALLESAYQAWNTRTEPRDD